MKCMQKLQQKGRGLENYFFDIPVVSSNTIHDEAS